MHSGGYAGTKVLEGSLPVLQSAMDCLASQLATGLDLHWCAPGLPVVMPVSDAVHVPVESVNELL